jgi:hypothetical protein
VAAQSATTYIWGVKLCRYLQQFALKTATNKNIKPIAGLCSAILLVADLLKQFAEEYCSANCFNKSKLLGG